jgi:threonine dehydratase
MEITESTLLQAHDRIRPYIHRTPVLRSESLDHMTGCSLFFKCENFQYVGAFKARGATNAVLSLSDEERKRGVATHSSGNHAQALARAAQLVGTSAHIVMPRTAPAVKRAGVLGYGGIIYDCDATQESRESTLASVVEKTGATVIHPFNDERVIAGQGTAAMELYDEVDLDAIIAPVGGGGLLSGTSLATHYFSPSTKVFAGEPEGADDAYRSMRSGKPERSQGNSIADGLLTSVSAITFSIFRQYVSQVLTVSDAEIVSAMKLLFEKLKIVVEPSGAVPFAAILKHPELFSGSRTGVIISGGNVDVGKLGDFFGGKNSA